MAVVYIEESGTVEGYVFNNKDEALAFAEESKVLDNECRTTTIKVLEG
jgi:hypothetical protein